jgi:hypothetical protein
VRGDLSIADVNVLDFVDSDRFAPGLNGLPLGRLPTSVAVSTDGCSAVVSNSGSCNLSVVNVAQAYLSLPDSIRPLEPRNAAGPLRASPTMVTAMAGEPSIFGSSCSAEGAGFVYVAFETCHLVARVDLASGMIIDGVQSPPGGPPLVIGPEVSCPADCDASGELRKPQEGPDAGLPDAGTAAPDAGAPPPSAPIEPSSLALDPDGTRLYAGARPSRAPCWSSISSPAASRRPPTRSPSRASAPSSAWRPPDPSSWATPRAGRSSGSSMPSATTAPSTSST